MKARYLFPNSFKKVGWVIFSISSVVGLIAMIYDYEPDFLKVKVFAFATSGLFSSSKYFSLVEENIFNEILSILIIVGALESLVWATYANYIVLIIAIILVYDLEFLYVLIFNMFIILALFILRFHWLLHKYKKIASDEE